MPIPPSISSGPQPTPLGGMPDAHAADSAASDAALTPIGPGARAMPKELRLGLIDRIIDWFRGGVRAADIAKNFDRICSDSPAHSVRDRLDAVVELHDRMNVGGRAALSMAFEQRGGEGDPLTMRLAIGTNVLLEQQIGPEDFADLHAFAKQPGMDAVIDLAPALRSAFAAIDRQVRWNDQREALCSSVQDYCHQRELKDSEAALKSIRSGEVPDVYSSMLMRLPGFDALDDAVANDLLTLSHLIDATTADAARQFSAGKFKAPWLCPKLDLESNGRYAIGDYLDGEAHFGGRELPTAPAARACVMSAVLMLASQGFERVAAANSRKDNEGKFIEELLKELTDNAQTRPGDLSVMRALDDTALNSVTYRAPADDNAVEAFEGRPEKGSRTEPLQQFAARFGDKTVAFSNRGGAFELRGAHLRQLLSGQTYDTLRELFLRVRGSEFDQMTHIAASAVKAEWALVRQSCDAPTQAQILANLDDVPMLNTTLSRVLTMDYQAALPPLGETVLSARAAALPVPAENPFMADPIDTSALSVEDAMRNPAYLRA